MRKKITNNLGLKVISLFIATIIWMVILGIQDPETSRENQVIPVNIINSDVLQERDLAYTIVSGENATFTYTGKKSVVDKMNTLVDFKAEADMSKLFAEEAEDGTVVYAVPVEIKALRNTREIKVSVNTVNVVQVELDTIEVASKSVTVVPVGTPKTGYSAAKSDTTITASPQKVQITGPSRVIKKINRVEVECDISNSSKNVTSVGKPRIYDFNEEIIEGDNISIDVEYVDVMVTIWPTKNVPLKIQTKDDPASGYSVNQDLLSIAPDEIMITAPSEELGEIDEIIYTHSVRGISESIEDIVNLEELLKYNYNNVLLASGVESKAAFTIVVEQNKTKELVVPYKKIAIKNKSDQYRYDLSSDEESFDLEIAGLESDVDEVTPDNLALSIDVEGRGPGTYEVPLEIISDSSVQVVQSLMITVVIAPR